MISYIALMAYVLAFSHVLLFLFFGNRIFRILFNVFTGLGFLINITELSLRWASTGQFPSSTLYDFLALLSAAFAATYFIIYAKFRRPLIGLFILPFPLLFSIFTLFVPVSEPYAFADSVWRYGHLPFIILGTTFFIASFLAAVMYFIQEKQLKGKRFGFVFQRFPPLDSINKINDATLRLGFYFFSVGAILGFIWMLQSGLGNIMSSYKIIFSLITWGVFAVIVAVKWRKGIPPRKMAFWTIVGFLSVVVTYIGVAVFLVR